MTKKVESGAGQSKAPARQGFYKVTTSAGRKLIAEWRERDKKLGKAWYEHVSATPTDEKVPTLLADVVSHVAASKGEVDAALKRELTTPEKVEQAYRFYQTREGIFDGRRDLPPKRRELAIGDAVFYGALKDCEVAGLFEDGRVVVLRYHDLKSVYGKRVDCGYQYLASHWAEMTKVSDARDGSLVKAALMYGGYSNSGLHSLVSIYMRGISDSPDYQRGYVWTDEDKERYLASVFEGRELGRFIFVRYPYPRGDEILDGKQRLNCIWQFLSSEIPYKGTYWHELTPRDRDTIENRSVQWATLPGDSYTRADLLRIFLEVNAAGVPQTEEHLAKVRALLAQEEALTKV